jgi:23S rRNA pseudouridine1911/1915/1917 synthase
VDLLALNKPVGLIVHPGAGKDETTLVHALLHYCDDLRGVGDEMRPGIVHRLDRDTSGVMLVAKHDVVHRALVEQFAGRKIHKEYRALARGAPEEIIGRIEASIGRHPVDRKRMAVVERGGKPAVTRYRVLRVWDEICEIQCLPETGRTHQIRVHLAHIGHPIWGDRTYGGTSPLRRNRNLVIPDRQMLHAYRIQLIHPVTGESLDFLAPFPKDWVEVTESLG